MSDNVLDTIKQFWDSEEQPVISDQTDVDNDEPNLGHLDLRRLLPILNVIPVLDTSVFKNLSVVVEYETDASKIVVVVISDIFIY